jgi:hypothetical protein
MTPEQAARVLNLNGEWTSESVKKAYKVRSRQTHPDLGGNAEEFKLAGRAREVLDAWLDGKSVFSHDADDEQEEEPEDDLAAGAWFDVLAVYAGGSPVHGRFRAQLVRVGAQRLHRDGKSLDFRWMFAVYAMEPVRINEDTVEVVIDEKGRQPSVFVRQICQRSYGKGGLITTFWFDPLAEPIIEEEVVYRHPGWEAPKMMP